MRTAIYSDVHGNLPAFEKFVSVTYKEIDMYLNLGDLVNYGPWSNECVDLALSLPFHVNILGNHEDLFIDPQGLKSELELVQLFFESTYPRFERLQEIALFSKEFQFEKYLASHTIDNQRIYPDTKRELTQNHLIGHTHHQFIYEYGNFELINPGSIGQNRKKIDLMEYVIFDDDLQSMEFFSLKYNSDSLFQKMQALKYPEACLDYYRSKL